jgi:drug/metabolite transporter (DMT)-like permease
MPNAFYFVLCTLIWGTTWFAINFQLDVINPTYSVGIRFFIAAICLGAIALVKGYPLKFSWRIHRAFLAGGLFLYALDYTFLYAAQQHIVSALLALMSSSVVYFNVILRRVLLGKPIRFDVVVGATSGFVGIAAIFIPELKGMEQQGYVMLGIVFALGSFTSASVGNIVSEKILETVPVVSFNFYTMLYGSGLIGLGLLVTQTPLVLPTAPSFYIALCYLAVFGSVIAFGCYMKLVQQMGSDRAAYVVLIYPVVALIVSTIFEGYQWSMLSAVGVLLILLGNACAMGKLPLQRISPIFATK